MKDRLRILHLEDDPKDLELVHSFLESEGINHDVIHAQTRDEFVDAIEKANFDLIFADYSHPVFDGLLALEVAKEKCPKIPFILISGTLGEELAVKSLKNGATDYILKQRISRLAPAVHRAVIEYKERIERDQAKKEVLRLASVLNQSSDSVIITDLEGNIEYVNPAFEEITGYSAEDVIGGKPSILKSGKHDNEFYKDLWRKIKSGETWNGKFTNRRKDGSLFHEKSVILPIKDDNDKVINFAAVKQNITGEIKLEEQLYQSQKMEAVGQLVGGIAHDFNNILSVINGYTELAMLKVGPTGPVYRELKEISQSAQKANSLVKHLLAYCRKQAVETKIVDLNSLISDIYKIMPWFIGEDINLEMNLSDNPCWIKADPGQIEQVFINLIVNARDAINQKSKFEKNKNITIETYHVDINNSNISERLESSGTHVCIMISDNGIGMDENTRFKIFNPFFTTKSKGEGTGLGLTIVYGIIRQNKSIINVFSEPGKGTTFKIYWPSLEFRPDENILLKKESKIIRGDEKVLLVEDDQAVRKFTGDALSSLGYQLIIASNGEEALKLIKSKESEIDILVTDIVMPVMGGKELADRLKKINSEIKILFTSGYTDGLIINKGAIKQGINLIQKPYSIHSLAKKVREALDNT